MLAAVVFDFDGIIVDTEPLHYRAFQRMLEPLGLGYSWEEYVERYMGFDDRDAFRETFHVAGKDLSDDRLHELITGKALAFQDVIAAGVTPYAGVVELVKELSGRLPVALCSGALASDITPILAMLGITECFSIIVTADDVAASKPDPASYLLAVEKLAALRPDNGIVPAACVAIEDTPAGIASAKGAGLKVVAVTNSYPAEKLTAADLAVSSLADMSPERLASLSI